jgi:predicted amidohydrolase
MSERPILAAAQFHSPARDIDKNLDAALEAVARASDLGAVLVVLPEFCVSGYDGEWIKDGARGGGVEPDGDVMAAFAKVTADRKLTVVFNDLERVDDRLHGTSFVVSHGSLLGKHRKTILTEGEASAGLVPGDSAATPVTTPDLPVPIGPLICFEHGFPEIAMDLALAGTGVIAISSAIKTGTEYLRNLRTRARAQDNGCYAVAANAVGGGYCGESMIVDPRGDVVARASAAGSAVIVADFDESLIEDQRRREPVLRLRRPELRPDHRLPSS